MTKRLISVIIACATGCNGSQATNGATALDVRFGSNAAIEIRSTASSDATDARLLIRATQSDVTVLFSIAWPHDDGAVAVVPDGTEALVWAKQGTDLPSVAVAGMLQLTTTDGVLTVSADGVSKPSDAQGQSLTINGSVGGIPR